MQSTAAPAEPAPTGTVVRRAAGSAVGVESPAGGRYTPVLEVASGGMATVWAARARSIGGFERVVALKRCHPHLAAQPAFAAMFLDEARLAAHIHHPNVVATLDVADDDGLYLVMDYVEGEPLAALLAQAGERGVPLPVPVALRVALDALAGLHAAHETCDAQGRPLELIHRDVSPQNVMVGADGVARLIDFGVARALERAVETGEGEVKGKLGYMPPEQLSGGAVTRRADVFAAGVVLWEALAGQRLFRADTHAETIKRVLRCEAPPLAQAARAAGHGEVSPALEAAVRRAIARSPAARFATAAEFAAALEASGAPVASAREVAAYVGQVAGESLAARREAVREALAADSRRTAALAGATASALTELDVAGASRGGSARWRAPVAAFSVVALLAAVVGVVATRARTEAPEAARARRAPAVVVAATDAPAARAPEPVREEPAAASAVAPSTAAAPEREAAAPAHPRPGRRGHRSHRAQHPSGARRAGGARGGGAYHPDGL